MLRQPYGYVDLPVTPSSGGQDRLNVSAYYDGLSKFIESCETPMTIAVQGDWGSGKSTALNFVKSKLSDRVHIIEFNTWLYSQFDLGESLVFSMAHEILKPIAKDSSAGKKMLGIVASMSAGIAGGAARGGLSWLGAMTGTSAITSAVAESLKNATYSDDAPNVIAELKGLRDLFAESVEEFCMNNNFDRITILIDDLDRVEPERAIEILEGLKLFFEVPKCVFVLALDFEVVLRGVRKRYGTEFKNKKARQYFDKIIQVPFSMPVGSFNVEQIVRDALNRAGLIDGSRASDFGKYIKILGSSVGTNPRSIKRLLNSFELLQLILASQSKPLDEADEQLPLIVFALLCAQAAYPTLHRLLTVERGEEDDLDDLLSTDDTSDKTLADTFELEESEVRKFNKFRNDLGVLSSDSDGVLNIDILRKGIALSQVTSVGLAPTPDPKDSDQAIDVTSLMEAVTENSNERSARLLHHLATEFDSKLGNREFSMIDQSSANQITMYTMSDVDHILTLGPRSRPRFASIGYSRKGLNLIFGRVPKTSDTMEPEHLEEDPVWGPLVNDLRIAFPPDGGPTGAHFRSRSTGYPFMLDGISKSDGMEELCEYLVRIYEAVADSR